MSDTPEAIRELAAIAQWVAYDSNKIPVSINGFAASPTDPETWGTLKKAKFIQKVQGLPGVGFVFSKEDDFIGVDLDKAVDPETGELKPWAEEIVEELASYTEYSPSGLGLHIWVKGNLPRPGARIKLPDGGIVEAYQSGRYFTVTGQHFAGTPTHIRDIEDLTEWHSRTFPTQDEGTGSARFDQIRTPFDHVEVTEWLGDALRCISSDDYDTWVRVGMVLKHELGESGFSWWDTWSASSPKYGGEAKNFKKWQSFQSDRLNMGTIIWLAEEGGFEMPKPPAPFGWDDSAWDRWLALNDNPLGDPEENSGLDIQWIEFADAYTDHSPFEPDLIAPGVLGTGDIALLFGPPKSMKSMALLDACRHWCQGRSWLGMRPQKSLRIAMAQFEVKADQMRKRIQLAKLEPHEVNSLRGNFFYTDRFTPMLTADFVEDFAAKTISAFKGDLDILIIDPIANIYTGDNENDNAQMTEFLRRIKALRNAIDPKVAIILVHHANKSAREDRQREPFNSSRGGSALRGAYDTGIYLDRTEDDELRIWQELRNGPPVEPMEIDFIDGKFVPKIEAPEETVEGMDFSDLPVADPDLDAITTVLGRQAAEVGTVFTMSSFSKTFHKVHNLGSESTLKRKLKRLCETQKLAYFNSVTGMDIPPPVKGDGYLCFPNMVLLDEATGRVHTVRPDRIHSMPDGAVVEFRPDDEWPNS